MTNYGVLMCFAVCWTCSAQSTPISLDQVQASLLRSLRGDAALDLQSQAESPHGFPAPVEFHESQRTAPSGGGSISIRQLQHKVPKEALRAASRAHRSSRAGRHSEAILELEAAILRDPEFASAQNALGIEYGRCGRLEDAAAAFHRVIELAPDEWTGHYNLALTMLRSGDPQRAVENARRALQLAPAQPAVNMFLDYLGAANGEKKTAR